MTAADRVTLISFAEQPQVLAEDATGIELRALLSSGTLGPPAGSADFAAAAVAAGQAARAQVSPAARAVIFLTADRESLNHSAMAQARQSLDQITADEASWKIIRVSASHQDSQWDELAQAKQGEVTTAGSAAEIYNALLEKLTGQQTTVARGVSLKLTFNPKLVTGYRLLGHEAATLTAAAADPLEIDFHADQTAVGLYELWVKPNGGDVIATAELTWHDALSGQPRRATRPLRREQLSQSFTQAPAWVQQGVVAAKTAEVLRGSYFAPTPSPMTKIRDLGNQVDDSLAGQPEFQRLLQLVRQAQKLR
jgi:Ca-activated chloride channel family protein